MIISSSDLINLPVFTKGGEHLGRVASLDVDIDTHEVRHYYIKTGLIKGLWHEQIMIAPSQVVSITAEKMIVEDLVGSEMVRQMPPIGVTLSGLKS